MFLSIEIIESLSLISRSFTERSTSSIIKTENVGREGSEFRERGGEGGEGMKEEEGREGDESKG